MSSAAIRRRRAGLTLAPVLALGLLALLQHWLAVRRPPPPELRAALTFVVTNPADRGPGSLREAIFFADRAPDRARVEIAVRRIELRTPLPPLVNPRGIIVDAGSAGCELAAGALTGGPVIEVAAPGSVVRGLRVVGAPEQAVLVRAAGVELRELTLTGAFEGVHAVAGARGLAVRDSVFTGNEIGIRLATMEPETVIENNRFAEHQDAAIWAVRPSAAAGSSVPAVIRDNELTADRIALVLGNVSVVVEDNELVGAHEAGAYLIGAGAVVRDNRIRGGERFGIYVESGEDVAITGNEIDQNLVGILLHTALGAEVRDNRVYRNAYGITDLFASADRPNRIVENLISSQSQDGILIFGGAPVVRANRSLRNRLAGLRLLDVEMTDGEIRTADPSLADNVFEGNGADRPPRGLYRVPRPDDEAAEDDAAEDEAAEDDAAENDGSADGAAADAGGAGE